MVRGSTTRTITEAGAIHHTRAKKTYTHIRLDPPLEGEENAYVVILQGEGFRLLDGFTFSRGEKDRKETNETRSNPHVNKGFTAGTGCDWVESPRNQSP